MEQLFLVLITGILTLTFATDFWTDRNYFNLSL